MKFYISFIIVLFTTITFAQEPVLKVSVSKNKLGVNQRLRIQYEINKQGADNFKVPNFSNFRIVGGPSQSVSQSWINGKVSFSKSYTYIIQPKRKGEFTLPSATIEIDGKTLSSKAVKIAVTDAIETPKDPNDPNYVAEQSIHLVTEVSKTKPYVGEAVYVEYRLYFSNNVGIYDHGITKAPTYNGFWNQDIKVKTLDIKTAKYNGEDYRYVVLNKALLIPTKAGRLTVDSMEMDIVVAVASGRVDFFGNPITRKVRKQFASVRKIVRSQELPLLGKPSDFNGAVGDFSYDVALSKNTLKSNESAQIKVKVSGAGNLKLFEIPKIVTPQELEVYQPERKEKTYVSQATIKGSIVDAYTVVPEFKGKYKIPSSSFSYFNPKDKKYHTIKTEDLYVDVLQGKPLPESVSQKDVVAKQEIKATGKDFRYIKTKTNLEPSDKTNFFKSWLFFVLWIVPFIFLPVFIVVRNKNLEKYSDVSINKQRKAERLARKYLKEAENNLGNKESFYESLERALHNYLKAKLKIETSDISRDKIKVLLLSKSVKDATIDEFLEVFKSCDFARYTPVSDTEMNTEYQSAKAVIIKLDNQL